ncbi:MAG: 16S rRNA processing protein RimM [Candidatus Krumholzibacteriota bacterium]|nr:16S rRNA processing protein RimM [Candidatus Krumholzibacteriota bacterium]
MQPAKVYLGDIVNTVGLKGEVKLLPSRDFWAEVLDAGGLDLVSQAGIRRTVRIEKYREKRNVFVLKFFGIEDIDQAQSIVGNTLEVLLESLDGQLLPKELRLFQVAGAEVFQKDGTFAGKVVDILDGTQQDCLVVEKEGERYLVPIVPEVVCSIDLDRSVIEIDPPEGLLDLRW